MTREFKFDLGLLAEDKITGFKGTITGVAFYLTGCNQYLLSSKCKDEFSEAKAVWYDEGRLNVIEGQSFTENDVKAVDNGADMLPNVGSKGY